MGKLVGIGKILECLLNTRSTKFMEFEDKIDQKEPLIIIPKLKSSSQLLTLNDAVSDQTHTLALHLKPKVVVLRVSMHCNGCARKVEKHISKMEGVDSYKVDLEKKMVVVTGDVYPFEVLQCVSKVKNAEIWEPRDLEHIYLNYKLNNNSTTL